MCPKSDDILDNSAKEILFNIAYWLGVLRHLSTDTILLHWGLGVGTGNITFAVDWNTWLKSRHLPIKATHLRQTFLLTSNRQLCHQDSSPSHVCPEHYSTCWFWPLPCISHICSLLSHQSYTASLVLMLAPSKRIHQQSLSRKLKMKWYLLSVLQAADWTDKHRDTYTRTGLEGGSVQGQNCNHCTKITFVLDLPSGFSRDFLYSAR